ncbi:MAG: aryl-sulfate sulfotransferase, partial [Ardenticatenaceae bacterium]
MCRRLPFLWLSLLALVMMATLVIISVGEAWADTSTTSTVDLVADLPSGQPVGTTITWTVSSDAPGPLSYRFSVGRVGEPLRLMYDYSAQNVFPWTPIEDGLYLVLASVRDGTGQMEHTARRFRVTSRVTFAPLITSTDHPLVALYSAPPCPENLLMRVVFQPMGSQTVSTTGGRPCQAGHSMNFYIAGVPQETSYVLRHELLDTTGTIVASGPLKFHATGTAAAALPARLVLDPPGLGASSERVVLHSQIIPTAPQPMIPFATNLVGEVIWYEARAADLNPWLYRAVDGGAFTMSLADGGLADQILREVDLAGHVVRQTTAARITEQLMALGQPDRFGAFHHEARRLPNGHTVVLGSVERILIDVQGPGPVDVLGDYVVVLDENWQVVWAWNAFDHLDAERLAVLGETCTSMGPGCPPIFLDVIANDWLHSNSVAYSPDDGNLILSVRHQDWVIEIAYQDGAGTGAVQWRLGLEGDFALSSGDDSDWFSHQHDAHYVGGGQILLYDNGNTRCAVNPDDCESRGQLLAINEATSTAQLVVNADLGLYSQAVGSAQLLANGNYFFDSGLLGTPPDFYTVVGEVTPAGTSIYSMFMEAQIYRSFRMSSLY